jgi:small subunit ribosomal protein S18
MAKEKKVRERDEDDDDRKESSRDNSSRDNSSRDNSSDYRPRNRNFRRYNRRQRQMVPAYVDWKEVEYLSRFIPERGKIMPRRISGVSAKDQRRIARAIKRARVMALLPYVAD